MSGAALLAEMEGLRIHIAREGETLRVRGEPGVKLAQHVNDLRRSKQELLTALREREELDALTDDLERGWRWMQRHPDHPAHDAFMERWIERLRAYEGVYRAHERITA